MKTLLSLASTLLLTTQALADDPVTKIAGFQCYPRGVEAKYMIWTEQAGDKQLVTVGTVGQSGIESVEKFISDRIHLDDIVTFTSKDETLKVAISNDFDGEFFAGDMVIVKNNTEVSQELACEEYVIKAD